MAFSFLTEDNIFDLYQHSKEHTERLAEPFAEYSRIARNRPSSKIPPKFPKVTDGTTASIIRKSARRVIQQLPTGVVSSDTRNSPWPILADFIYRTKIVPNANVEYDLIQKCWNVMEDGKTFGYKAVHTPLLVKDGELLPDYVPIYWGDIFVQPGKKSGKDSDYVFMRSWWQEGDIESLIDTEENRQKQKSYKSVWDLDALRDIQKAITPKDETARTPSEDDLVLDPSGIEIVVGFQRGVEADIYVFSPVKKKIIGRKKNIDPRGEIEIDWYYYDSDGSNPLGRSMLNLTAPVQNLIDSDMQAYQYSRAAMLRPTVNVFGNVNEKRLNFGPNALNKIQDPNVRIEAMEINTSALRDYPNNYGLQKSQLMNLANSNADTSISSEVGNPGFGKTPTAIKTQNASMSVDDNAERKSFEAHYEDWSETAINRYFGARNGKEKMQLDEETANKLRELEGRVGVVDGYTWIQTEPDAIVIDFSKAKEALKFKVDASTSKLNNEAAQLEALQVLITTLDSSQSLSAVVPMKQKLAVWNAIVANTAVENAEELKVSEEEVEEMQKAATTDSTAMQSVAQGEEIADTEQDLRGEVKPTDDLVASLKEQGVSDELISEVPAMLEKGYSKSEIIQSIQGVMSQEEKHGR